MKRISPFPFALLSLLLVMSPACKDDYGGNNQHLDNITLGPVTDVSSTTIGIAGGSIKVSKPGTPVDGMEIVIPDSSYPSGQTIKISYAEIQSHKFGEYFNPISPMITIACDGGYANELLSITIPVKIPAGHIAIGFYLDESTGKLEGIPFKSITSNSITLLTRHFLSGNRLRNPGSSLKSATVETNTGAKIIVSSISESILKSKAIIASGFQPGIDDWEFVNVGSYLAPSGQCAGQDMTAMWYYFEKKESEGQLFNKFSTVTSIDQDNAIGYRFCSVIQKDLDGTGAVNDFFWTHIDRNQDLDPVKLFSIAGAMLVTGEPQGMSVYMQTGTNADGYPIYDGHDLICYQVSMTESLLYISDPNTPGREQKIELVNDKFEPYVAKQNGNAAAYPHPLISWYAKTAWIEWNKIGIRYAELVDSTIGNIAPNTFPGYTIWVKGKVDSELKNGFSSDNDTLRCFVECPDADLAYPENGKRLTRFSMHDENGYKIDVAEYGRKYYVILKPGLNRIGFYITARITDVKDPAGNFIENYIDFKWFNVIYSKLKISPNPISGDTDTEIKIIAMSGGSAPKNAKYVWIFGDGTAEAVKINDSIVKHKFSKDGNFTVVVKLYDNSTDKMVGTAAAKANIGKTCNDGTFDYEGRTYTYKNISTQTWMIENLAYLPSVSQSSDSSYTSPHYYVYGYQGTSVSGAKSAANYTTYGVLYNWAAALTACPSGWHLPSDAEWNVLINYLGGASVAGGKMKETGTIHWLTPNTGATNESCFSALPGGYGRYDGGFGGLGTYTHFWSSSKEDKSTAWGRGLGNSGVAFGRGNYDKSNGFSVRCLKN
jgi:uncharacterized protein (TIGR02145 family)